MDYKEFYKLPLKHDYGYVFSTNNNLALNFARDIFIDNSVGISEKDRDKMIDAINGEYTLKGNHTFTYTENAEIHIDGKPILVIRGWGGLTGTGGGLALSEEEAIKIQDDFGEFIINRLNIKSE